MPSSLIYATRMNHFLIGLLYTMTSDVRPVMTSSVVELRKSSKVLCKARLAPKERSRSLFGDLLPIWSTIAFWIPVNPWHLRSMPSKLMRCTKNCNASSLYWSTERAQLFSTTTSDCISHNQHFKRWKNWAMKFCLTCYIHPTSYHLFKHFNNLFARKTLPQPAGCRKCFPRACRILKHRFLCYSNSQTYFSLPNMWWL